MKTAILGGGLTGLTLARFLCEAGEEVVVLEAEPSMGGLCRSRSVNGFCFDTGGSHIIFSRDREVLAFMLEVLGENREDRKRNTKIFYKDHLVKYPFENGHAPPCPQIAHLPCSTTISGSESFRCFAFFTLENLLFYLIAQKPAAEINNSQSLSLNATSRPVGE